MVRYTWSAGLAIIILMVKSTRMASWWGCEPQRQVAP
jgi:hypothetical protein